MIRAKRKIAEAGVSFEVPGPQACPERLDAVLSTIEIAYGRAHEGAAGSGLHFNYAAAMLDITRVLADAGLAEIEALAAQQLDDFLPYHAVRADLLRRAGRRDDARIAYDAALALVATSAERVWLERQRAAVAE